MEALRRQETCTLSGTPPAGATLAGVQQGQRLSDLHGVGQGPQGVQGRLSDAAYGCWLPACRSSALFASAQQHENGETLQS